MTQHSIALTDTIVTTEEIDGKDLRDRDVIVHPSGAFPPVEVTRVVMRNEYAVTFRARIIHTEGTVTREGIGTCQHVANLARLTVERAAS